MKKLAVILLLLLYGSVTIGATVHLHYCMNHIVSWSFWHSEDAKCSKCGMKEKVGGCCKEEHKQIRIQSDQLNVSTKFILDNVSSPGLIPLPVCFFIPRFEKINPGSISCNAPPPRPGISLCILHCVYRIWSWLPLCSVYLYSRNKVLPVYSPNYY